MVSQYVCERGHIFLFPKIVTEHTGKNVRVMLDTKTEDKLVAEPGLDWLEVSLHVCPVNGCHSTDIKEYFTAEPDILSVKSVPLEEVDGWLAKGYVVHELYAKSATIKKTEEKK